MLLLIAANGYIVRLVKQNVRRHQRRIGKQAAIDILGIFRAFILKLRHARQLAEHRVAVQYPAKLRMGRHMALNKQGIFLRIETAGDILRELLDGAPAQIGRLLPHGDRVQVGHEIIAVKFVRPLAPVFDRAQIRTKRQIAGGLDAG